MFVLVQHFHILRCVMIIAACRGALVFFRTIVIRRIVLSFSISCFFFIQTSSSQRKTHNVPIVSTFVSLSAFFSLNSFFFKFLFSLSHTHTHTHTHTQQESSLNWCDCGYWSSQHKLFVCLHQNCCNKCWERHKFVDLQQSLRRAAKLFNRRWSSAALVTSPSGHITLRHILQY